MSAYYNEFDPFAAQWLRELIKRGHIAPGEVDERSIEDVSPHDLDGFTQCHFFAGIGVWSYALRQSGWPDDKPVWTGSCPCQPFSAAGKSKGFDDERHLWPAWHWLIAQRQPAILFGEQVASKAAEPWIDLVQTDLEAMGYAFGCVPFPSAGVGAPHIRDRAYWVANAQHALGGSERVDREDGRNRENDRREEAYSQFGACSEIRRLANTLPTGHAGHGDNGHEPGRLRENPAGSTAEAGGDSGVADPNDRGEQSLLRAGQDDPAQNLRSGTSGRSRGYMAAGDESESGQPALDRVLPGPTNGHWRAADWLFCRDGKWRPVEPGTFPLAHGAAARVGRLRGYGNAINAQAAQAFIEAYLEAEMLI